MTTETQLTAVEALGVALSVQAPTTTMGECQEQAPGMLEHLRAMGFDVVPSGRLKALEAALRDIYESEPKSGSWDGWRESTRLRNIAQAALISDTDR